MAIKREFYKGSIKRRRWPITLLIIFLTILAIALLIFYGCQKYVVYSPNGVSLELPILAKEKEPTTEDGEPITVDNAPLVIDQTDYSNLEQNTASQLKEVKAIYVPSEDISKEKIDEYTKRLSQGNALTLQLKPASGRLAYKSSVPFATNYDLNGTLDIKEIVAELKSNNIYLVAELSCFVDTLLATRSNTCALLTTAGISYSDDDGGWVNPYSQDLRTYIIDLSNELLSMGFDEILLTNVYHPNVEVTAFSFSDSTSTELSTSSVITSFCLSVTKQINGIVSCAYNANRKADSTGMNLEVLSKVFDRLYVSTSATFYADFRIEFEENFTDNTDLRLVRITPGNIPESSCWMIKDLKQ